MKISVVMASFNSAKTVGCAIDSFLRQRHADKELVIVDGGSTDATADIVRNLSTPDVTFVSEKDKGIYDAMNKGLARAAGEAIGCLNSDDTFHDADVLGTIADALADADVVYGDISMVTDHDSKAVVRTWKAGNFSRLGFHLGWVPPHPAFYIRRHVLIQIGGFDLKYRIASDYDFMLRAMMRHKFETRYVPRIFVDYQMGGASSNGMKSMIKGNLECLDSRRRHLGHLPVDLALFLRPARRILQINWSKGRNT